MNAPPAPTADLRPLRLGEILDAAIKLTVAHISTFLAVVVVATGPVYFAGITFVAVTFPGLLQIDASADDLAAPRGDELPVIIGAVVVLAVAFLIASVIATGACFQVVDDAWRGREPDWRQSLRAMVPRIGSLLWLTVLLTLAAVGAFMLPLLLLGLTLGAAGAIAGGVFGAVVAIYLVVRLAFGIPVLIGEDRRGTQALRRSWDLVGGRWWRTFGVLFVGYVLASVIAQLAALVVSLPPSLIFPDSAAVLAASQFAGYLVGTVISTPAIAAVFVVTYFDLRVRKEGYDLELRAASLGGDGPAGDPSPYAPPESPWTEAERAEAPFWPPPPGWQPPSRAHRDDAD